ncbi:PREDICTED: phosphatidylinositol 3-kinase catalytic subunit type 3-like, partial [Galeopterus variegatus]|uniref:Phosphatidylinositol 3-kinase catalytic subunit type 3-like n=1 Tax=Galeopterus variegatus TaxID=482537 RepID=A0ABM0RJA7_GALVR
MVGALRTCAEEMPGRGVPPRGIAPRAGIGGVPAEGRNRKRLCYDTKPVHFCGPWCVWLPAAGAGFAKVAMGEAEKFYYIYSCDLDINVQLKIGSLEGKREQKSYKAVLEDPMLKFSGLYQETCSDLYVTCQVFAEGKPLALPVRTSYKAFSTRWNWNEWLKLPVKYPDLPRNAQVALTIWDVYGPGKAVPVGGTTVSLFGKYGMFRQGMHDLKVWPNVEADGSEPTKTPGRTSSTLSEDQMSRLAK